MGGSVYRRVNELTFTSPVPLVSRPPSPLKLPIIFRPNRKFTVPLARLATSVKRKLLIRDSWQFDTSAGYLSGF